ncbi:protein abrupt [Neodiprion lecontei]|uniref:Protein abrupt n=1 Tax=Neodiprion lecontei TaxID=441921 RepID=A0A6J0C7R9_NEOLC|nr:protein abrupt [Neodiprion lecontei]XP_046598478.1 protein abrupt [Neodiprion lecontei]XP_046598479.1 protein abrupt [Neodiprion lecontei]XP_046598480.1 protein abrupt [Neodiprion lecontei]XP_046598481.1 protein abrupt [Neodiprion lecontei]XP_046598482.1 protein abrupt [Neodiprion lecontei]
MESQQQFCLRWHNFQNTLLSSLPKLLDGGYLTDVTLSAGGRHIRAHKIILSACSYYFKELFKDFSIQQHPVIVLPGTEYADLCALVTFMYNGEVNIYQEQLPAILAMADTLHIRGLADIAGKESKPDNGAYVRSPFLDREKDSLETMPIANLNENTIHLAKAQPVTAALLHNNLEEESSNEQQDTPYSLKIKPYYSINEKLNQREKKSFGSNIQTSANIDKNVRIDESLNECMPLAEDNNSLLTNSKPAPVLESDNPNFGFLTASIINRSASQACNKTSVTCLICGKQLSNQYNLRVHMETHNNSSYSCTACPHVSRSRDALRKHVSYRHPVASPQKRPRCSSTKP